MTQESNSISWDVRRLREWSKRAPSATTRSRGSRRFYWAQRYQCRSNLSFLPLHTDLSEKVLAVSSYLLHKSFLQRRQHRASPTSGQDQELHGRSIDGSGSANRKRPDRPAHDKDEDLEEGVAARTHRDSYLFGPDCSSKRLSSKTRITSLSIVRVDDRKFKRLNRPVSNFCYPNLVAKNVHLVATMRPVFKFYATKLRLYQIFWLQNLDFQSQNAIMRPDFSSPDNCSNQILVTYRISLNNSLSQFTPPPLGTGIEKFTPSLK